MKKAAAIIICFLLLCTFSACSAVNPPSDDTYSNSEQSLLSEDGAVSSTNNTASSKSASSVSSFLEEDAPLTGVNVFRPDYGLGTCRNLKGNIAVGLFYMDDFESSWDSASISSFTHNEIKPALDFLENEAAKRGVDLNFEIKTYSSLYYDGEVIVDTKTEGYVTVDVLDQAAVSLDCGSDEQLCEFIGRKHPGMGVICLTIFNKNGTPYALNPKRDSGVELVEHCVLFAQDLHPTEDAPIGSQASLVAHEILYLFGAEDLSSSASREAIAKIKYPRDIMLDTPFSINPSTIGDATAFYIGWTDEVPEVLHYDNWKNQ